MASTIPRRRSLFEQISGISVTANNEYVLELMAELNEFNEEARGFRWAAVSTQLDQDRVLHNYQTFLVHVGQMNEGASDSVRWSTMFPADFKILFHRIRL